jgi:hypothetical protein
MNINPEARFFDKVNYNNLVSLIHNEQNKTVKERYFREIAKQIIITHKILNEIYDGPGVKEIQGVPFDLIGWKGKDIYIIELKGSEQDLNFPKEVQLVRMESLINLARKENIELKPLLLQINLKYFFYCLWPTEFLLNCFKYTDQKLGSARPIKTIVDWIKISIQKLKY